MQHTGRYHREKINLDVIYILLTRTHTQKKRKKRGRTAAQDVSLGGSPVTPSEPTGNPEEAPTNITIYMLLYISAYSIYEFKLKYLGHLSFIYLKRHLHPHNLMMIKLNMIL